MSFKFGSDHLQRSYIAAGVAVVGGVTSVVKGINASNAKAKNEAELAKLKPSFYKIQDEYVQNRNIAGNLAGQGLPSATQNYLTTEGQRGLGTSIAGLSQNGGNPNDVGRLNDVYNRSIDRTAAEDAQVRLGNINNFMNYNKELAGQKTMQWTLNELRPYERKLKQLTGNIAAEKVNQNNALNEGIGYASSFGTAISNDSLMRDLFKNNQSGGGSPITAGTVAEPIKSSDVRSTQGATINPNFSPNIGGRSQQPNQNNNDVNVFDPNTNPYGEGNGYWDGTMWIKQ